MRLPRLARFIPVVSIGVVLALPGAGRAQFTFGQISNFNDGTTQNWGNGVSPGSVTVGMGGPGGATDPYLRIDADGSLAGGRLVVFNRVQWLGNYNLAGVHTIEMDLFNFSATALAIRVGLKVDQTSASPGYVTSAPGFTLPPGAWTHATFPLRDSTMSAVGSPPPLSTMLNGFGELRILHTTSATPIFMGDQITAVLGIDNIQAVPEPACILALTAGAVAASAAVRRGARNRATRRQASALP